MKIKKSGLYAARKITAASLAVLLMFSCSTYTHADADSISSLKEEYSQLQEQQQQYQIQINDLNDKVSSAKDKQAAIDKNVELIRKQIELLDTQMKTIKANINDKDNEIKATEKRIETNKELYKKRVCTIYETGNVTNAELLLSSKSVSDFLMKFELLQTISEYDNKVANQLKKDQGSLTSQKKELEASLAGLQGAEGSVAAKQEVLKSQLAQQQKVVNDLKKNKDAVETASDAVSQKARETDAQINAEIAKEAAARRRELEGKPAGNSGTVPPVSSNYIVNYAEQFLGIPYVFRSADPSVGFDCSGFVQYVFANAAGKYLPHSAAGQAGCGSAVTIDKLQPGDLVFFGYGGSITHVGIYIGGGQMIDAPHTGSVVRYDSISSFHPGYICARRIL